MSATSRNRIRECLSRIRHPRNHEVSPEGLGASRLLSFVRAFLNTCHPEDRCFFAVAIGTPSGPGKHPQARRSYPSTSRGGHSSERKKFLAVASLCADLENLRGLE